MAGISFDQNMDQPKQKKRKKRDDHSLDSKSSFSVNDELDGYLLQFQRLVNFNLVFFSQCWSFSFSFFFKFYLLLL